MSKAFTSKPSTTNRGRGYRGRGTNTSTGRSIIKRAEVNNNLDNHHRANRLGPLPPINSTSTPGKIDNNRGKGTNRFQTGYSSGRNMSRTPGDPTDIPEDIPENSSSDNSIDSRISHASGYSVISPNEKKRREIVQQAKNNLQAYEQHKEESRVHHVSYVGTAGGGLVSEQEARQKAAIQHSKAAFNSRMKRESLRKAEKEKEEAVYNDKKMAARKQTELNQEREKKEDQKRNEAYRDEMRRKNAQFLDRLEAAKPSTSSERHTGRTQDNLQLRNEHPKQSTDFLQLSPESSDVNSDYRTDDLHRLQVMFPNYTRNDLSEILNQMGSLQLAVDILSD